MIPSRSDPWFLVDQDRGLGLLTSQGSMTYTRPGEPGRGWQAGKHGSPTACVSCGATRRLGRDRGPLTLIYEVAPPPRELPGLDAICYIPEEGSKMMITAHCPSPHTQSLVNNSQAIWCKSHQGSQAWSSGAGDVTRGTAGLDSFCQQERSWCNTLN